MNTARSAFCIVALAAVLTSPVLGQDMALPEPVGMEGQPAAQLVLDGNTAFLHGDLTAAADDYRNALHRKPDLAVASFNLGLVEAHQGDRKDGLADMDRGLHLAATQKMAASYIQRLRALRAAFAQSRVST